MALANPQSSLSGARSAPSVSPRRFERFAAGEEKRNRLDDLALGVRRRSRVVEKVAEIWIWLSAWAAILAIFLIFAFVAKEALPLLWEHPEPGMEGEAVTWAKLIGPTVYPDRPSIHVWQPVSSVAKYNLAPLVLGTLKATFVAILFAAPLAILAAVFSSELAPRWLRELIKPTIELLAGLPSVVLGFFALVVMATALQEVFGFRYRLNAINAGIALGLAVIPIIFTVTEDALTAVPRSYREASLALGATRWETTLKVVLPAALPGMFAGVVLGFGRAVGETMIVLMASGNAAVTSWNFSDSVRTMSATVAAELGEVVFGSPHYRCFFSLA
jgi:phosphate transport system permease protein